MPRRQKLMTAELRKALPALYANEDKSLDEVVIVAKFFNPYGRGTFYITEFDGEDTMFGAVDLGMTPEPEWGYISLSELEEMPAFMFGRQVRGIQGIERDAHWTAKTWGEVRESQAA